MVLSYGSYSISTDYYWRTLFSIWIIGGRFMEIKFSVYKARANEIDRCFKDVITAWYTLSDLIKKTTTENFDGQRTILESYADVSIMALRRLEWLIKLRLNPLTLTYVNEYIETFSKDFDVIPGGAKNISDSFIISIAVGFEKHLRSDETREVYENAPLLYGASNTIEDQIKSVLQKHNVSPTPTKVGESIVNVINDNGFINHFIGKAPNKLGDNVGPMSLDNAIDDFTNGAFLMENPNDSAMLMQYALYLRELKLYRFIYNQKDENGGE